MYIPFFVVICLMCGQASPLLHLTKSCLCVVLLEAPKNAHFSHSVWMLLLFPCAEQMRQFILLAKEFGQWCQLAPSRRNIVNDRAGGRPNRVGERWRHFPACSSMLRARAKWKSLCDSFAPEEDSRTKLFRIIRSSKWKKCFFVHFQVRQLMEYTVCYLVLFVNISHTQNWMYTGFRSWLKWLFGTILNACLTAI
jgi:hypothetical protein